MLEAAYNDSAGVTAEFNKNVLSVLNRELGADFDLDAFEHVAFWDDENLWVDIRLRSLARQVIQIVRARDEVAFGRGEEMRTEISTKFAREGLDGIYAEAGLEMVEWWTDPEASSRSQPGSPRGLGGRRQRLDQLAELVRRRDRGQDRQRDPALDVGVEPLAHLVGRRRT